MKSRGFGSFLVILAAVAFGCIPLMATSIYAAGVGTMQLLFLRFTILVPASLLIVIFSGGSVRLKARQFWRVALMSLLGAFLTCALLFTSYKFIDTGLATTTHFTYPVFVLLISAVFFRERITLRTGICFALCLAGMLVFFDPSRGVSLPALLLALLSGIAYAGYIVLVDKTGILGEVPLWTFTFWYNLIAAVLFLPTAIAFGEFSLELSGGVWLALIGFAVLTGCMATPCFQKGIALTDSRTASLLSTFEPMTSIAVGAAVLSEKLTLRSVVGCALVLASVILLVVLKKRKVSAK